jgi:undecaprenyl-diphosphatase
MFDGSELLINTTTRIGLIFTGTLLFVAGLTHRIPAIYGVDKQFFLLLNKAFRNYSKGFAYIWPLGTTPVAAVLIAMTFIVNFHVGTIVTLVFSGISIIESFIKRKIGRGRPFNAINDVKIFQPSPPTDASFPSGDAMRISYLAMVIPIVFELSWITLWITSLGAAFVCVGRIALGVHYPLDVIGGIGIGLIGAGLVSMLLIF